MFPGMFRNHHKRSSPKDQGNPQIKKISLQDRGFLNFHQNPQTLCLWENYQIWLVDMFPMGPSTYPSIPIALKTLDSKKSWQLKEIGLGRWKTILIQTKDTQARSWTRDLEDMTSLLLRSTRSHLTHRLWFQSLICRISHTLQTLAKSRRDGWLGQNLEDIRKIIRRENV